MRRSGVRPSSAPPIRFDNFGVAIMATPFPFDTTVRHLTDILPVYAIILVMNKKAKKRLKEAIQKEIADKVKTPTPPQDFSVTKNAPESRGFTAKPEKKRG